MPNSVNWLLVREWQTVSCQQHNLNGYAIFIVHNSPKLAKDKVFSVHYDELRHQQIAKNWKTGTFFGKYGELRVTWSAIVAHNICTSYPVPEVLSMEKEDINETPPLSPKWLFKFLVVHLLVDHTPVI